MAVSAILQARFNDWLSRRHGVHSGAVTLHRRRVYILPSGAGYAYCGVLLVMLLWAINYSNSLAFALTFLLGAVALNAMWRSHNNLLGLHIQPGGAEPTFVGQDAQFHYSLSHPERVRRYSIGLRLRGGEIAYTDVPAAAMASVAPALSAPRRGWLRPGPLRVQTEFPLGLFKAWSWVAFEQTCLVYPEPRGALPLPVPTARVQTPHGAQTPHSGNDDYAGLRGYSPGDSPRHIAWRVSARRDALLVKRWQGQARSELWLDWAELGSLAPEPRLSQLCRWVVLADSRGHDYGLRLPGIEITPASGAQHRRRCLQALALFDAA